MKAAALDPAGQWYSIYEVLREMPSAEVRAEPTLWHVLLGVGIDGQVRNGGWPQLYWNLRGQVALPEIAETCAALGGAAEAEQALKLQRYLDRSRRVRAALDEAGPFGLPRGLAQLADRLNAAFYSAEPTLRVRLQEYIYAHRAAPVMAEVIAQAAPYRAHRNQSTLHRAADDGNLALVRRELARGVDPNIEDDEGDTPLMEALGGAKGPLRSAIVDALIFAGADVNRRDWLGRTTPEIAKMDGDMLARLAVAGLDITRTNGSGATLLHAVRDTTTARSLLKAGVDPNARSDHGITPLHLAAMRYAGDATTNAEIKRALSVVRTLVKAGAVNCVTPRGQDAFWFAADAEYAVRGLAQLGLQVMTATDDAGQHGVTALHRAAANRDPEVVRLLVKAGAPVNARTRQAEGEIPAGATPLTIARAKGSKPVINALIKLGAEE